MKYSLKEPIRIVLPKVGEGKKFTSAIGTQVFVGDVELTDIKSIDIRLRPKSVVEAEITIMGSLHKDSDLGLIKATVIDDKL
jgi:hypothetical protein